MVSADAGQTWDRSRPVQLALSAKNNVGWPVTLQLKDGSLLTAYALTAYLDQPPDLYVTEVVRWRWPIKDTVGHGSDQMLRHYSHIRMKEKREVMEAALKRRRESGEPDWNAVSTESTTVKATEGRDYTLSH